MSNLSFGVWGAVTKYTPAVSFDMLKTPLDTVFNSAKVYTLPRVVGPCQITIVEGGTNVSSFNIECPRPVIQSSPTPPRNVYTNIKENCAVVPTGPTASTDMRRDWFDVTCTTTTCKYLFKFSPYQGIPPTVQYNGGGAAPATVVIYIENAGEFTRRNASTSTYTSLSTDQSINRVLGVHRIIIKNPDGTYAWFEIDGTRFGNVRQNSYDGTYYANLRPNSAKFNCTVTYQSPTSATAHPKTYFSDYVLLKITSGTYVYNLKIPTRDLDMTINLDATSTPIGVGENVKVTTVYYDQNPH